MKGHQERLDWIQDYQRMVCKESLALLKDYIIEHGEIDWTDEECQLETTFYCDGYFTAKVLRVYIDNERGLVVYTDEFDYDEYSDAFTNDTLLDILCFIHG